MSEKHIVLNIELWPKYRWLWAIVAAVVFSIAYRFVAEAIGWTDWGAASFNGWLAAVICFGLWGKLRA